MKFFSKMPWIITFHILTAVAITLVSSRTYSASSQGLNELPSDIYADTVTRLSSNNLANADFSSLIEIPIKSMLLNSNGFTSFPNLESIGSTMTHINLGSNSISEISSDKLDELTGLKALELDSNAFTHFPNLTEVGDTLEELDLSGNMLTYIASSDLSPLIKLRSFMINRNYGLVIEDLSSIRESLQELRGSTCYPLQVAAGIVNMFRDFTNIKNIALAGNNLNTFPDLATSCGTLTRFVMSNNRLETVNTSFIDQCTAMETFNLERNLLTSLPNITAMDRSLKHLNVQNNKINQVDQDYMRAQTALEVVNMHNNQLIEFPDVSMSASTLTGDAVRVKNNMITSINPAVLGTLVNIESLDMRTNQLTLFPDVSLPKLSSLNLSKNKFTSMPTFINLGQSLVDLHLSENDIYVIHAHDFTGLTRLQTLSLDDTKLTVLPDMQYLTNLTSLSLANTPITIASSRALCHLGKLQTVDFRNTQLVEISTMCLESSLTLLLENNNQLNLCSSKMAWLKQTFFTVTYTDVMCNKTGKMWSAASFDDLLDDSDSKPQPGDVKRM